MDESDTAAPEGAADLDLEDPSKGSIEDQLLQLKPETEPYDPLQDREKLRGVIALSLIGLLALISVLAFVYLFLLPLNEHTKEYIGTLTTVLQIIFGPIVTLVGTAVGYYFGSKSRE